MYMGVILSDGDQDHEIVCIPHVYGGDPNLTDELERIYGGIPHVYGGDPGQEERPTMYCSVFPMYMGVILGYVSR